MKKVGIYEAKTHLSRLIADVKLGDEVLIHDRGKPVAKLVGMPSKTPQASEQVASFRELRSRARRVSRKEAREWIEAGRK